MLTRSEFATWLKVEVCLSLAAVGLAGAFHLFGFGKAVVATYFGGVEAVLPYVVGVWVLVVAVSFWYAGRFDAG